MTIAVRFHLDAKELARVDELATLLNERDGISDCPWDRASVLAAFGRRWDLALEEERARARKRRLAEKFGWRQGDVIVRKHT